MGDRQQTGHLVDGWRKVAKVITDNMRGGMQKARAAVADWIKTRGK